MPPNNQNNQYFQPQQTGAPIPPVVQQSPQYGKSLLASDIPKKQSHIGIIITFILLGLILAAALAFGLWAFLSREDYKNNVNAKIAVAVKETESATTEKNTIAFNESQKNPLKKYVGPASYGTVNIEYPKTWSGYVSTNNSGSDPLVAIFHPDYVPANSGNSSNLMPIALNVTVLNQPYDNVVATKKSTGENGLKALPYVLPKMPQQVGIKLTGKMGNFTGTQVILPIRDKTLVITTETDQWLNDFNTYVLANITFVP